MVDISSNPPNATSQAPDEAKHANLGEIEAVAYRQAANDSNYASARQQDNEMALAGGKDQSEAD